MWSLTVECVGLFCELEYIGYQVAYIHIKWSIFTVVGDVVNTGATIVGDGISAASPGIGISLYANGET